MNNSVSSFIHYGWFCLQAMMDCLNIFWMYKIIQGALSFLNKDRNNDDGATLIFSELKQISPESINELV